MRFSVFRGFLIACLALVGAVFSASMPATAGPVSTAHVEAMSAYDADHLLDAPEAAVITWGQERINAPDPQSSADLGSLPRVCRLSMLTNGQSPTAITCGADDRRPISERPPAHGGHGRPRDLEPRVR